MANTNTEVAREIAKRFMGGVSSEDILNRRSLCAEAIESALSTAESNLAREVLNALDKESRTFMDGYAGEERRTLIYSELEPRLRDLFIRLGVKTEE